MHYRLENLGTKTGAELVQAFRGIPAGVTFLNLSFNSLHHKTGAELAEAFPAIPAGVTSLDLSFNGLHHKTVAELAVVGCAAVATAFILLNAATFGVAGLVVAGLGAASILAGVGLFAAGTYRNRQETPHGALNLASPIQPSNA